MTCSTRYLGTLLYENVHLRQLTGRELGPRTVGKRFADGPRLPLPTQRRRRPNAPALRKPVTFQLCAITQRNHVTPPRLVATTHENSWLCGSFKSIVCFPSRGRKIVAIENGIFQVPGQDSRMGSPRAIGSGYSLSALRCPFPHSKGIEVLTNILWRGEIERSQFGRRVFRTDCRGSTLPCQKSRAHRGSPEREKRVAIGSNGPTSGYALQKSAED